MSRPLTPRQQDALAVIRASIAARGYAPSRRELCAALGCASTNAVTDTLKALERKGAIEMTRGIQRGLRVVGDSADERLAEMHRTVIARITELVRMRAAAVGSASYLERGRVVDVAMALKQDADDLLRGERDAVARRAASAGSVAKRRMVDGLAMLDAAPEPRSG